MMPGAQARRTADHGGTAEIEACRAVLGVRGNINNNLFHRGNI